jgi:ubiquinone biosynthesis accessory factor UbiK
VFAILSSEAPQTAASCAAFVGILMFDGCLAGCVPARWQANTLVFQAFGRHLTVSKKETALQGMRRRGARTNSGSNAPLWCEPTRNQEQEMNNFFNDLQGKLNQAIENSPAKDIERNVKAIMTQGFSKLDLVTREEFDIQAQVLAKTRAKLDALEARVAELEAKLAASDAGV